MTDLTALPPIRIPPDHPCLPGHFPGQPVVPGVLILDEVLTRLRALSGEQRRLQAMPQVKFLAPLLPDQLAQVEVESITPGRSRFRVSREGRVLASGELAFAAA